MDFLQKIEAAMAGWFKGAPKLSDSTKESLVKVLPWLAVIGGVLHLWSAWNLYDWARVASGIADYANSFSRAFGGGDVVSDRMEVTIWIGVAILAVQGVVLLLAYPGLTKRLKSGWNMVFLYGLLSVVYAVVSLFMDYYSSIGGLFMYLIVAVVTFYLLFAVRDKFKGTDKTA